MSDYTVEADRPPEAHVLEDLGLADLWNKRLEVDEELQLWRRRKTALDAELVRRFRKQHPDFDEHAAGGRELASDDLIVTLTWSRDFQVNAAECAVAATLVRDGVLTQVEYDSLVKWLPKLDGRVFNQLLKRGGAVAEALNRLRTLKGAVPHFDVSART